MLEFQHSVNLRSKYFIGSGPGLVKIKIDFHKTVILFIFKSPSLNELPECSVFNCAANPDRLRLDKHELDRRKWGQRRPEVQRQNIWKRDPILRLAAAGAKAAAAGAVVDVIDIVVVVVFVIIVIVVGVVVGVIVVAIAVFVAVDVVAAVLLLELHASLGEDGQQCVNTKPSQFFSPNNALQVAMFQ